MAQPAYVFPEVWTEADLDTLPDDGHRYEIIEGALHMTPAPGGPHQNVVYHLSKALDQAAIDGYRVRQGIGVRVPDGCLVPDVVVLNSQAELAPGWWDASDVALVVEVASRSTESMDRGTKAIKYAQAGIPSYWRVARDGAITVGALIDGDWYNTIAVVRPGTIWKAAEPFPVELDPAALAEW